MKPYILQLLISRQQTDQVFFETENLFNIDNNQRLASLRNFLSSSWMISFFFCLANFSLKRSKSLSVARFFFAASLFAQEVCSHFSWISPFWNASLTGPLLADGRIFTVKSVRERYLKFKALRHTLVQGPSIRACFSKKKKNILK